MEIYSNFRYRNRFNKLNVSGETLDITKVVTKK